MADNNKDKNNHMKGAVANAMMARAHPLTGQKVRELQPYGTIVKLPIALEEKTCAASVSNLNQLLADTMTLRDLYKKHHWQVSGPTFYQLHLLFDKHFQEQSDRWLKRQLQCPSHCGSRARKLGACRLGARCLGLRKP